MGYFRVGSVGVFLQVRINSTRLPFKAILPLKEKTVIQHVLDSLSGVNAGIYLVLTDSYSYPYLKPYVVNTPFEIFVGPSEDVLARYYLAAIEYSVTTIIRATGDNPLVSAEYVDKIVSLHMERGADLSHYLGIPLGSGVEVIDFAALKRAYKESKDPFEREHITTYMYRHRDEFTIIEPFPDDKRVLCNKKVSIDAPKDYELISRIYRELYTGKPIELVKLVSWLKSNN